MSQTVHGKLHFDRINFGDMANGVNLRFLCPVCRYVWQPKLDLGSTFPATFDYNQKVSFPIPSHNNPKTGKRCGASGQKIELFVAVHKDAESLGLCVQRSDVEGVDGIPANWWQKETP